jgi:hypothetical protein
MTRVLLVGGFPQDVRRIGDDLKPYGVTIDWQWQSRAEARRKNFPACDAVLVVTKACSHSLQDGARNAALKAGVPLVVFTSKSRSLKHLRDAGLIKEEENMIDLKTIPVPEVATLRPTSVAVTAALNMTPLEPPPKEEALAPKEEPPMQSKEDRLLEIIIEMHDKWAKLAPDVQKIVTKFLVAYDTDRSTLLPPEVVKILQGFRGNPRGFLAFVLHATQGSNIMQNTAVHLHLQFFKKSICATSNIPERARGLCGPNVGFRRADKPTFKSKAAESAVAMPPQSTQEMSMSVPPPIKPVPPPSPSAAMTERFNRILMAAVESGEKITVQKAQNGTAYAITYEDGVTLTLSAS